MPLLRFENDSPEWLRRAPTAGTVGWLGVALGSATPTVPAEPASRTCTTSSAAAQSPKPPHCGVKLADMAEGERPQKRPERRRRHRPDPEHRLGAPSTQHAAVIDAVPRPLVTIRAADRSTASSQSPRSRRQRAQSRRSIMDARRHLPSQPPRMSVKLDPCPCDPAYARFLGPPRPRAWRWSPCGAVPLARAIHGRGSPGYWR
jgi:hypothetical protein